MTKFRSSNHYHNLAEGIIWDHYSGLLLFVDILSKKLFMMDINSFNIIEEYLLDEYIGWVQITNKPELYLVGMKSGIALFDIQKSKLNYINKDIPQYSNQRLNDSFVDTNGKVWYGTMEQGAIQLYNGVLANYSSADKKVIIHDDDYGITNGPIINHQNNYLFHTDSKKGIVYKFSLDLDKNLLYNKSPFIEFDTNSGVPDGMCFDKKGDLFIAIWGEGCVKKYSESGEMIEVFKLPEKFITNVCFAGKNLDRFFVTTAAGSRFENLEKNSGYVYEILDHGCKGVIANEFLV